MWLFFMQNFINTHMKDTNGNFISLHTFLTSIMKITKWNDSNYYFVDNTELIQNLSNIQLPNTIYKSGRQQGHTTFIITYAIYTAIINPTKTITILNNRYQQSEFHTKRIINTFTTYHKLNLQNIKTSPLADLNNYNCTNSIYFIDMDVYNEVYITSYINNLSNNYLIITEPPNYNYQLIKDYQSYYKKPFISTSDTEFNNWLDIYNIK